MTSILSRLYPSSHTLKVIRIVMFTFLYIVHLVLIGFLWASLAANTGTLFESLTMAVDWLALITLALYAAYTQLYNFNLLLERQYAKAWLANLWAFFCCGFFSLGNAVVFTVRTVDSPGLCADFSGITKSCGLANSVLVLSWLAVLFCVVGALARYMDWDGFERAQAPSPEHYHVQTVEVQPPQSLAGEFPSQGLKVPISKLSHKGSYRVPPAPPSPTRTIEYCLRQPAPRQPTPTSSASSREDTRTEVWTTVPV
ncbi:hypothetical protein V5O48_015861 [Marasmius crinis-equi]|uniref:MARVEL domain-containing protein n=1 Tax=Marasmius crinis-equi TaxID=585013 RepID=A0ABR3ETN0_9AGAR